MTIESNPWAAGALHGRVVYEDGGGAWFAFADSCRDLDLLPAKARAWMHMRDGLRHLHADGSLRAPVPACPSADPPQGVTEVVSEAGLYWLIDLSPSPAALEWTEWAHFTLLPFALTELRKIADADRRQAAAAVQAAE